MAGVRRRGSQIRRPFLVEQRNERRFSNVLIADDHQFETKYVLALVEFRVEELEERLSAFEEVFRGNARRIKVIAV